MWICFNDGFVSIVNDFSNENMLLVRSRRRDILEKLFPKENIVEGAGTDYKYRMFVEKEKVVEVIKQRLLNITYGNFKNSVVDNDLHDLYGTFWYNHFMYQK